MANQTALQARSLGKIVGEEVGEICGGVWGGHKRFNLSFLLLRRINMKKLLIIALAALGAVGCTTSPVSSERATPVPKERMLAFTEPNPDYAKVQIIRDSGALGSGCYFAVMYRQTILARFDTSEKGIFYLPEGDWKFAVTRDPDGNLLCGADDLNPVFETQHIRKNQENLFRISLGAWRRPRLLPM